MTIPTIPTITITIETAKLKPIRCKNKTCPAPILGFAYEETLYCSDALGPFQVSVTGEVSKAKVGRRTHTRALRSRANRRQDRVVRLLSDDSRYNVYYSPPLVFNGVPIGFVFGYLKNTGGRGISVNCRGCNRTRTIRGMKYLISTRFVDFFIDNAHFKS